MKPTFTRLETQLERLIEGAFTQLFSRTLRPHDLAVQLSRAMENGVIRADDGDVRPVAPDQYTLRLHPDVRHHLLTQQPDLPLILCQHITQLAAFAGYRLLNPPVLHLQGDATLPVDGIVIHAETARLHQSTAAMQPVPAAQPQTTPHTPTSLIIDGTYTIMLTAPLVTLGRGKANDIILDDPHISRQHAQLRLRAGSYIVFDTHSQSGTFVNEVAVREHTLHSGDVIRIGKTRLVYFQERPAEGTATSAMEPVDA